MTTKKKILVVEDTLSIMEMLKLKLKENNYDVITACDGEKALQKAYGEKPDLIILDLMIPKLDGYMICSLLKKDKRHALIPIIMLTARAEEEDKELGRKVGADAYIIKPFESKVLLDKIKELLHE